MKIAVASGKGGTGKTTIALALAEAAGKGTELLDCDVEEPNCHLFIKAESAKEPVTVPKPVVNEQLCCGCRRCSEICQFNAIAVWGKKVLLFNDLCHGCGGCVRVCPTGALTEEPYRIGEAGGSRVNDLKLIDGRLAIGQAMSPPLIRAVQERTGKSAGHVIIDSPPGTSCP
ncbi:MAG: 4Fe-4S binding protein, partial [Eubacteriales bacterium]|nr:4Fe-4S binding protein [Eubacteriales bacterium]